MFSVLRAYSRFPRTGAFPRHTSAAPSVTYYVDATSGSDEALGTSTGTAWKTLSKVNSSAFNPGETIALKAGERWRNDPLVVPSSGTAAAPITITSYGAGADPILDGSVVVTGWTNDSAAIYKAAWTAAGAQRQVYVDDLRLTRVTAKANLVAGSAYVDDANDLVYVWCTDSADPAAKSVTVSLNTGDGLDVNGKQWIAVSHVHVTKYGRSGFGIRTTGAADVTFTSCTADWNGLRGFDWGGTGTTKNRVGAVSCTSTENLGEGFWIGLGDANGCLRCYAYNNGRQSTQYTGVTLGESNFTIHGTTTNAYLLYNHSVDGWYGTSSFGIEQEGGVFATGAIIACNLVEQIVCGHRVADSQGHGSLWYNNILVNMAAGDGQEVLRIWNQADGDRFYFNTFRQTSNSKVIYLYTSGTKNIAIKNNVLYADDVNNAEQIRVASGTQTGLAIDRNVYYGKNTFYYVDAWKTFTDWQTYASQDANSAFDNPDFVNLTTRDFHLQAGSPCIGAGDTSLGVTTDYDGVARGVAVDAGAFEYVAA